MIRPPTDLNLTSGDWRAAAALGALRMAVNDGQRHARRDRGQALNILNDLIGAIGEIICLAYLEELGANDIKHQSLNLQHSVDDVDFRFHYQARPYAVEVKCELLEPRKSRFLINEIALTRSKARGAQVFIPIISSVGSSICYVGKSIPLEDIEGWPIEQFQYGDPACSKRLFEVVPIYFRMQESQMRRTLEASAGQAATIADLELIFAARAELLRTAASERLNLSDLTYRSLLAQLSCLLGNVLS
jgi:hypothetical protein